MREPVKAYPLQWPIGWKRTPPSERQPGRFATHGREYSVDKQNSWRTVENITIGGAVSRVRTELARMGIAEDEVVISTNLRTRLDGLPASKQAQPDDPGAAVYWVDNVSRAQRCMAIDQYTKVEHNLAAIAATLEAMRAIERHGGAAILDRAFTGFTALPAPMAASKPWRQVLGFDLDYTPTGDDVRAQYRIRRGEAHLDRHGGAHDDFLAVQAAYEQAARELGFAP